MMVLCILQLFMFDLCESTMHPMDRGRGAAAIEKVTSNTGNEHLTMEHLKDTDKVGTTSEK